MRIVPVLSGDSGVTLEYDYTKMPTPELDWSGSTGDVLVIPVWDRHVLADAALALLLADKRDSAAMDIASLAQGKLANMEAQYIRVGKRKEFRPRGTGVWR